MHRDKAYLLCVGIDPHLCVVEKYATFDLPCLFYFQHKEARLQGKIERRLTNHLGTGCKEREKFSRGVQKVLNVFKPDCTDITEAK